MKTITNKKAIKMFAKLCGLSEVIINEVLIQDDSINIKARIRYSYSKCPICGRKSKSVHSYYSRNLQDMPISLKTVRIQLQARRFYCNNHKCTRITFSEQVSSIIKAYARRTTRVNDHLRNISIETSAIKSSYLSNLINLPVSPSTCLRLLDSCEISQYTDVEHIGIDDWAYRKGMKYGTIVVDRKTGKAIDLIKSREKDDIITWLNKHPNIKSVTRDRAKCYSSSVKIALPKAIQIADRFHLIVNYSECIYKIIKNIIPELKQTQKLDSNLGSELVLEDKSLEKEIEEIKKLAIHQKGIISKRKKQLIEEAKILYSQNLSFREIGYQLGIHRKTIAKYINYENNQIDTGRSPRKNYSLYLNDIIEGFCRREHLSDIYKNIKSKGFNGNTSLRF